MATATGLLNAFKNSVGNLAFGFQNMGTAGTIGMDAIKQGVVGLGGVFLALGAIVAVAAAAVAIGLGVQAVRAAGDFQQSVTKLFTTAGELHQNLAMVGTGILTMAGQVGTGAQQLVGAMYYVESGGYHGAAGLEVLRIAAMGAKAENADLNGVAKVLTFTMNAYAGVHMTAATAMNTLIASTARGTMTLAELSGAVSNVLPAAARFGISLTDVGAALATMTSQGDKADSAATHLRQVILALEAPSKIGAAALKSVGLTTQQVADEMKISLPGALQMITDAVGKKFPVGSAAYNAAIRDIAGGSRQMMGFLELTGVHLKTFQGNVDAITDAVHRGGASIMGWADVQANLNFKIDAAKASFGALLIIIGMQLLPVITRLLGQIAPLVTSFTQWLTSSGALTGAIAALSVGISAIIATVTAVVGFFQRFEAASALLKATLIVLAAIVGGMMVAALYSYAAAAYIAAAANIALFLPIYAVIAAVIALVAAFIYFYNTSATFRGAVQACISVLLMLWNAIVQGVSFLSGLLAPALAFVSAAFARLGAFLGTLWPTVQKGWAILQQGNPLFHLIGAAITAVLATFQSFGGFLAGLFVPVWQHLMDVGRSLGPVLAQLSGAGAQLMGALRGLWASIQPLIAQLQSLWAIVGPQLLPVLQLLGIIIVGVVVTAFGLLVGVLAGVIAAIAGFLQGVIIVVQGIVQVFTGLVQIISGIVALIVDVCTGNFGQLASDLGLIWQGILNVVQGTFTAILGIIVAVLGAVIGFVWGFVTTIIGFFTSLYNALVGGSIVPDMVNGIINWFMQLASRALSMIASMIANVIMKFLDMRSQAISTVQNMVSGVAGALGQLAGIAASAGAAFISALVGQINAGVGWVASAVGNLVQSIWNMMPHSPAKEGPLRDLDKFGPALTGGFAAGIRRGLPEVRSAAAMMVQPVDAAVRPLASGTASAPRSTGGGNREIVEALGRIERQLAGGRRVTSDEIIDALGNGLTRRILTTTGGIG